MKKQTLTALLALASVVSVASGAHCRDTYAVAPSNAPRLLVPARGLKKTMALIPGGSFQMGSRSKAARPDEGPVHQVLVSAFYMDQTPLTYAEYRALSAALPRRYRLARPRYHRYASYNIPDQPVTGLRWHEAACICNLRSLAEGLQPAYTDTGRKDTYGYPIWKTTYTGTGYRLPTEAEFEYAARGGRVNFAFAWGNKFSPQHANYDEGRGVKKGRWWRLARVKDQYRNAYNLYGMNGNIWEWSNDYYSATAYAEHTRLDPRGPKSGRTRVIRGGSWGSFKPDSLRNARRGHSAPGNYNYDIGLRCVRPVRVTAVRRPLANAGAFPGGCVVKSGLEPLHLRLDSPEFRKRLGQYLADYASESVYLKARVDRQDRMTPDEWAAMVIRISRRYRVHPLFVVGIMKAESGLGTVSFPRWFNNPMAYHWGNWKMRYGRPLYRFHRSRNRGYRTLEEALRLYSGGIRRRLYTRAARQNLYRFHYIYVGYQAREWMHTLSTVYRDVLGVNFDERVPPREAGQHIYQDWKTVRRR